MKTTRSANPVNPKIGVIGVQTIITAILVLAIALTLSGCPSSGSDGGTSSPSVGDVSSSSNGGGTSSPGVGGDGSSSSSKPGSSSSVSSCLSNETFQSDIGPCIDGIVTIGTQTWQRCNLNVEPSTGTSACYDNDPSNCEKYGRLYDWSTAMALPSDCNTTSPLYDENCTVSPKHQGLCPSGWHIPSNADWDKLYRTADGTSGTESPYHSKTAGRYLKATSGWSTGSDYIQSTDDFGFSALPGGYGWSNRDFHGAGYSGNWWSSAKYDRNRAYIRIMACMGESAGGSNESYTSSLYSVRCVED
ncbi:hypothetical protein R83H12_00765 [Fibrobacteria bacterium R8-3-H12]